MSPSDSQPLSSPKNEDIIIDLLPHIPNAVRCACRIYGYYPTQDEVDDLSQSIILLLIDQDYRRLNSFNHKSSLKTWLQSVIKRYVLRYLQERKRAISVEHMKADDFAYRPNQEEETLIEERQKVLGEVIAELTKRELRLFELMCRGMQPEEISEQMKIKVDSVYRSKHALINKLKKLVKMM